MQPSRTSTGQPFDTSTPGVARGLRDVRYGEVLLLRVVEGRFQAEVWNTLGLNDCPQEAWDQLDATAIAAERGALLALLNGPRHWTLDSITSDIRASAPETTFGSLGMFQAAILDLGDQPPEPTPYTERSVLRETVFGFDAGSEIYELVSPDGTTYVLQAYSLAVDPTQTIDSLAGLGHRIAPPEGWTFGVRTLAEPLDVLSTDGVATVIQDELLNTYQRVPAA